MDLPGLLESWTGFLSARSLGRGRRGKMSSGRNDFVRLLSQAAGVLLRLMMK